MNANDHLAPWIARLEEASDTDGPWEVIYENGPRTIIIAYGLIESTAKKIAAAPNMLAALKAAIDPECIGYSSVDFEYFRDNETSRKAIKLIRDTVARATT